MSNPSVKGETFLKLLMIRPEFVEFVPDVLEDGIIYVSMTFAIAVHRCCCGCGMKVVTPLDSNGWKLSFDGRISLTPSIGNFQFECRSHYVIKENRVEWIE